MHLSPKLWTAARGASRAPTIDDGGRVVDGRFATGGGDDAHALDDGRAVRFILTKFLYRTALTFFLAPRALRRHVAGFSAIRFGLLPRSTLEGLGAYVATIGLPSVLFDTIAHLSFDSVNWYVVFAVVSAKLLLVLLSISLAWLTTRRADGTGFAYTLGGVNALLSTMSDDMGIGMPIFAALFSAGPGVCRTHLFYSPLSLNATRACLPAQSTSPSSSTSSSSPPYNPPLSTQSSSSSSASAEPMQRSNAASSGVRVLILTLLTAAEARETGAGAAKAARLRAGMAERAAAALAARVQAEYSSRSNRRRYRPCYWR